MLGKQQDLKSFETRLFERLRALKQQNRTPETQEDVDGVEIALKRLGWGNYKFCMKCWGEIEDVRLEEDPTRMTCGGCASKGPQGREPGG
ncbi:MAG: hypothetical protein P1P84_07445 [Deferrisomatales bacterium]|nr:hypothetical protein [Deferrisomatales bacterium]